MGNNALSSPRLPSSEGSPLVKIDPKNVNNAKIILIIGGGYAGVRLACILDKQGYAVTLVEKSPVFVHKIASLRASVVNHWEKLLPVPYDKVLKRGNIVRGRVFSIDREANKVILENKQELKYDYLVIATGSPRRSPFPAEVPESTLSDGSPLFTVLGSFEKQYAELRQAIKEATRILILGGGPVGVELTGEILDVLPEKDITLVHAGESLLDNASPALSASFQKSVLEKLQSKGVNLLLGQRVEVSEETLNKSFVAGKRSIKTSKGEIVETDLVILCTGKCLPNQTSSDLFPKEWMSQKQEIEVNDFLQIRAEEKSGNLFAIGDVTALPETKLASYSYMHAEVVAKNIAQMCRGKAPKAKYVAGNRPTMILSFGKFDGFLEASGGLIDGMFRRMTIKSMRADDLQTKAVWKIFNQPMPNPEEDIYSY